ncbi:PREDICTED: uncharacterized protein LOC104825259 isoform X2 [Tarenaya hassleriana]|nr:PREDICTED: uncharacterized protein LOC104825259 isoform X2 [Tarenaya hassleriana]
MDKVSTPPGFVSQTSFVLKQVSRREGRSNLSRSGRRADKESFESCLWSRPWILHDQATHSSEPPKHEVPFVYDFKDIQHAPKITTKCYPFQIIRSLKKVLTDDELIYFNKKSQFRHIFHMRCEDTLKMAPVSVLLHRALRLECEEKELWFILNGVPIRYSITEHAIISGLNCDKYPEDWAGCRGNQFRLKTFGTSKVTISGAVEKLYNTPHTNVERRKRLATLILLGGVIDRGIKSNDVIKNDLVDMVDRLDFCEGFPWGRYTFEKIIDQIRKVYASGPKPKDKWHCPGFVIPLMLFPFECVERLGASQWYIDVDGVDPTCPRMCKKRIKPNLFITHANVMKQIGVTSQGIRSILQIEGEEEHIFFNLHEKQSSHPVIQSWMQHLKMNPTSICFENIRELDVDGRAFVKSAERKKKEKGKKREEEEKEERIEGEEEKGKEKGKKVFFERILKKTIDASEKRIIANVERILKRAGVTVEALEWSEIRSNKEDDISTGLFAPMRKMKKKKGGKEHVRVIEVGGSTGTTSAGN